jgi:hypothetical protein
MADEEKLRAESGTFYIFMSKVSLSVSSSFFILSLEAEEGLRRRPEYRLLWAVLQEAIETYMKYAPATGRRGQRLFQEAEEWIMQDNDLWLYSFINVCRILDLDPDYIRTGLKRWRSRTHTAGIQAA